MPSLNTSLLSNVSIVLPPLREQVKIAAILRNWDQAIEVIGNLIEAKQRLKKGLMQQLLTGRVRFPAYTGVEWEQIRLGKVGTFAKGSGITKSELVDGGIPCVRYGELYTRHDDVIRAFHSFISRETATSSMRIISGDVLFAGSGETAEEIGKCATYVGEEEAYAGGDVIILRPSKGNSVFLGYLLNHDAANRQKYRLGQGHSVVHIYPSLLKDVVIPFPPVEEQRKIADVLETLTKIISLLSRKIDELKAQKQGLMQRLLTGEVRVKSNPIPGPSPLQGEGSFQA